MPTVFDLCPSFIEAGVEDVAGERLMWACKSFHEDLEEEPDMFPISRSLLRYPYPEDKIHRRFFGYPRSDDRRWEAVAQKIEKVKETRRDALLKYMLRQMEIAKKGLEGLYTEHLISLNEEDYHEIGEGLETIIQRLKKLETPEPYPPPPPEYI